MVSSNLFLTSKMGSCNRAQISNPTTSRMIPPVHVKHHEPVFRKCSSLFQALISSLSSIVTAGGTLNYGSNQAFPNWGSRPKRGRSLDCKKGLQSFCSNKKKWFSFSKWGRT